MPEALRASIITQVAIASQMALGIVFLMAALPKLRRPFAFARSVVEYQVLPQPVAFGLALALIPLEILLAIAFLTARLIAVALPLAALMVLSFLVAVVINLRRGRRIRCGCFGDTNELISPRTFARLLMLLVALLLLVTLYSIGQPSWHGVGTMLAEPISMAYLLETLSLAVFLVLMAAWILNLPELIFLSRSS